MPEDKKRIRQVVEEVKEEPPAVKKQETPSVDATVSKKELQEKVDEVVGKQKRGISFKLLFFLTILTALVVGFVSGGVYVYWTGIRSVTLRPEPTPQALYTPEPSITPEGTPEAETVDLSKLKVSILNGSGKIGEAGKVEKLISDAGFVVTYTGNAKSFDFDETLIEFKSGTPESVIKKLTDVLDTTYVVRESSDNLSSNSTYDIVITVGSKSR